MRFISLAIVLLLFSCNNKNEAPDVSRIKTDVTIHRFDKDFFSIDTLQLQASLTKLEGAYPAFLPLYFKFFAPVREMAAQQAIPFDSALVQYIRFIKPLYQSVTQKFADVSSIEKGLEENLRYVKHYFPQFALPVVLTSVESLNPENPTEIYGTTYYHDTLIISLQMFLGKDYPAYDPSQYPDYLRRRFSAEYIVPNSIRAIAGELYLDSSQSASLIEQMIEKGKQWWLMKKFLPDTPDSLITGYSAAQTEWVQKEEGNIWGYINQNEKLFSIELPAIQTYIGEAPFTQALPHDNYGGGAPGNIGPWVGWRIISKFEEKNGKLTVNQVLRTTAKKIFEEAKYKPK
ncbi:MAG TPA: hypothetical protein VEY10_11740 [Flavisolibacter sp.]|jgi:hypothetical protein|nr:hypothetical protein [Flavisolibacter sp.]